MAEHTTNLLPQGTHQRASVAEDHNAHLPSQNARDYQNTVVRGNQPLNSGSRQPTLMDDDPLSYGKHNGSLNKRDIENPPSLIHPAPTYSKWAYLYYRWINPWIRIAFAVPIVYFYAVLLNVTTYRVAHLGEQTLNWPQSEVTYPRPDNRGMFLVLDDGLYHVIPRAAFNSMEYLNWKKYCDFCSFGFNFLVLVTCIIRRDVLRLLEQFGLHITLYVLMYFTKVITLYPAPVFTEGCMKPEHRELGMWIFKEVVTTDFCGDQMFSGHTNNTLLPLILFTRILYDIVGWDFRLRRNRDDYHEPEYSAQYEVAESTPAAHPTFTDANEDVWFHPRWDFREKSKIFYDNTPLRVVVWCLVTFWRIAKWVILGFFVYGLIHIRQHYTADIFVSMIIQIILVTNTRYVQSLVRWIYRPNYWNYKRMGLFCLVKLRQPLTPEQVNYEDRVAKLGRGGIW